MKGHKTRALQIGVTGGIGSGKSMVCKIFSCLGVPVYDADTRAKWLTNTDEHIRRKIIELLGTQAYDADGRYDRAYVSSVVFEDELLLKKLNAIVHPVVMDDTKRWFRSKSEEVYVIKEAAVMNRAGDHNVLDYVIVVEAPVELRIKRILARDHRTKQEVRKIIERQISDENRSSIADYFIYNDEASALIPQVMLLHQLFIEKQMMQL